MSPRHVPVVGAGGFIGCRVVARLLADGHRVTCAGRDQAALCRRLPGYPAIGADLATTDAACWALGLDVVVNTAGILRGASFTRVARAGVSRWGGQPSRGRCDFVPVAVKPNVW